MGLGNNFASSPEIEIAALLLQQQINVWLECEDKEGENLTFSLHSNLQFLKQSSN